MRAFRLLPRSPCGAPIALFLFTALLGPAPAAGASVQCEDPTPIVAGLDAIVSQGFPGPLYWTSSNVVPIIAGDEDTPEPHTFAVATGSGAGRVIAFGHDGVFTNSALGKLDNRRLATQALEWLDTTHRHALALTTGHGDWGDADSLRATMSALGWTSELLPGVLDADRLSHVSVLIVGNAHLPFTAEEKSAVLQFVENGGGLLMTGLGWSWVPYNPPSTSLDDYPMNQLAAPFGIRWIDGSLEDPTDRFEGSTCFHTFHPNLVRPTGLPDAFDILNTVYAGHAADLPDALAADEALRGVYTQAHLYVLMSERLFPLDSPQRLALYEGYRDVLAASGPWYRHESAYERTTRSAMAYLRERAARTLADAAPLSPERRDEIAQTLGLAGIHDHLWRVHGTLLLDNMSCDGPQTAYIDAVLDSIPPTMHDLRSITVEDFYGHTTPAVPMGGIDAGGVNVFGIRVGWGSENAFPDDSPPGVSDLFCVVVAHEVNHVVDHWLELTKPGHRAYRDTCIQRAGPDPMNYLRSMGNWGGFLDAPVEFFAGTSNQWFTDSWLTVQLGISRFLGGRPYPIDQVHLFVDAYSNGDPFTRLFRTDTQGHLTTERAPVGRDGLGRITDLWHGTDHVRFELDALGHAVAVSLGVGDVPRTVAPAGPSLALFPNPARDGLWVRLSGVPAGGTQVTLHDCAGRRVRTIALGAAAGGSGWLSRRGPNGTRMPAGLYFARASVGGLTLVARVVLLD